MQPVSCSFCSPLQILSVSILSVLKFYIPDKVSCPSWSADKNACCSMRLSTVESKGLFTSSRLILSGT